MSTITYSGGYRGVAMASAETSSENMCTLLQLMSGRVGDTFLVMEGFRG